MSDKLKRGQKKCPECWGINAARQRICKDCLHEFAFKNEPAKNEILDWKSLQKGDLVKVIQGSGPYYIAKRTIDGYTAGEKIYMGTLGVFRVMSTDSEGIHSYGATSRNGGYNYIFMGKPHVKDTGVNYSPYRIKKVKIRKRK